MRETEIKLPLKDLSAAADRLRELGAVVAEPRHFEDNLVLDTKDQMIRKSGRLLRLRLTGPGPKDLSHGLLTLKGTYRLTDNVKDREETESEVTSPENFKKIMSELGFEVSFRYQKYRTTYRIPDVRVEFCIDETPIGNYFEIEGDVDEIHRQASRLGFSREGYITESYATLYNNWCKSHSQQSRDMVFP
jgi:adenylate cyclase, class 2